MTDNWSGETYWTLTADYCNDGIPAPPTIENPDYINPNTMYSEKYSVKASDCCYTFTMFDDYHDGMCCEAGDGHYELLLNGELSIGSGGDFEDFESWSFGACV